MKAIRWGAVAATVLISLMNLPVVTEGDTDQVPTPVAWAALVVGVAGLAAAAGLARRLPWGRPAVVAIGALNVAGGIAALVAGWDGAIVGFAISVLALGLGWFSETERAPATALR